MRNWGFGIRLLRRNVRAVRRCPLHDVVECVKPRPVVAALPGVLLLVALAGCARTQSLRVVDAHSGAPLGDVWVSQGGVGASGYTLKTDASGMVQFRKSGGQYSLSKEGYEESRVEVKGSVARIRCGGDPQGFEVEKHGDLVQVPLRRRDPAIAANAPPQ